MAYVSKETKAKIAVALKEIMPEGWKYSLSVRDLQLARLVISKAPVDLVALCKNPGTSFPGFANVDYRRLDANFSGEVLEIMKKIERAMNIENHEDVDSMRGYYDVGYHIDIHIGREDKPFQVAA